MSATPKLSSAPVRWTLGQPLLPEHLEAQEESLRDELRVRLGYVGSPLFGVARLAWDSVQLERGVVRIRDLTLILPNGRLLDIPGNCEPVSFDLEATGSSHVSLFLTYDPTKPHSEQSHGDPPIIERVLERVSLAATRTAHPEAEVFHLVDFLKNIEGQWALDTSFIPPCVGTNGSLFFISVLERLERSVDRFHQTLVEDVRTNYLARQVLFSAQQSIRELFKLKGRIADCTHGVDLHPYELFCMVRDLYVDACIYRDTQPIAAETPYVHKDAGTSFRLILDALEPVVESGPRAAASYTSFEVQDGHLRCTLSRAARKSSQVYLLVQKASVGQKISLDRVKLASPSRLPVVQRRALRGVPFKLIDTPPFHHDFGSEVEFYALTLREEWDHAINEGILATYNRSDLKDIRLFLLWNHDS